jgi:pimeloyl-ACP methyl ester carboxylesterase
MTNLHANERVLVLASGRRLGLAEYGDPEGAPVLVFHGLPGSRRQRHPDDAIARDLRARTLHLERPGFGLSDPAPGRALVDWVRDVDEACGLLGLSSVRVAGISGGGPYALACAALLGRRVRRTIVVSGVGPPRAAPASDFTPLVRLAFALAPRAPWSMRPFAALAAVLAPRLPEKYFEILGLGLNAADRRVLARRDVRAMFVEDMACAFAQSGRAFAQDLTLITSPWGFDPTNIALPLALWHGTEDRIVPFAATRAVAARVPHADLRLLPGEGHYYVFERWREILDWLMH